MNLTLLHYNARCAVIETDGGKFTLTSPARLSLNGVPLRTVHKTVEFISGLKPDTEYTVALSRENECAELKFRTAREFVTLNVRDFGARGDGVSDDTVYIQAAISVCPRDSRVLVPAGKYRITSLFLKSNIRLELARGAELVADSVREHYPIFKGMLQSYDGKSEYNLGTWEGNPLPMFSGTINAIDVTDCDIYGEGAINGAASYDNWWHNEKVMNIAFRPRLIFLERSKNVTVSGISFRNSPAWTIHPYFCEDVRLLSLFIENPMISPNTDGIDIESCKNTEVVGVHFTLGDDCIALKSGKLYMGRRYGVACDGVSIRRCLMENGHGAVIIGSEMSAGVKNVTVEECEFCCTDRGLRIKTRRGRGNAAVVDNIVFRSILMDCVKTPLVINCFYFCDPDGRTEYVQTRETLPVDERTPYIERLEFTDMICRNCHVAAAYFMGLPEKPIGEISLKNIVYTYANEAVSDVPAMHCNVESMCRRGIVAENVGKLTVENVTLSGCEGDAITARNVGKIEGALTVCS